MNFKISAVVLLFIASLLINTAGFARDFYGSSEGATDGDMAAEWLARPAGAMGTIAGIVTFIVGLPFSVTADNTEESYEVLVKEPFMYTFHRPMGHYEAKGNY